MLIIAILPWIVSLIESARFPGGWEIKFRDIQSAGNKIIPKRSIEKPEKIEKNFEQIAELDPNLALIAMRIEIEKRVRNIAKRANLDQSKSLATLFVLLKNHNVIDESVFNGLKEMVDYGNQAAHGAKVEPAVSGWAISFGPYIFKALDELEKKE